MESWRRSWKGNSVCCLQRCGRCWKWYGERATTTAMELVVIFSEEEPGAANLEVGKFLITMESSV